MKLDTKSYLEQAAIWPSRGRHILAQHDDESIVVYQAYQPEIGDFAAANGYFGGRFRYARMSWIKPNFLWMMYRSGWGTKPGQETTLAIRLSRSFFDEILASAVPSSFSPRLFEDRDRWQESLHQSDVRLQWDPDHGPTGHKLERRAVQLGLRGKMLERYGKTEPQEILDISGFVAEHRAHASPSMYSKLVTPVEEVYEPASPETRRLLNLSDL